MPDTITITGNVATAPEQKRMPDGGAVTTFRLASSQRRFDRPTNAWVDGETNWFTVSVFRTLAEHAFDSLRKGERIIVTGRLKLREWETETKKGWTAQIDADAIGHDLLFGTTKFERATPATSSTNSGGADSWSLGGGEHSPWPGADETSDGHAAAADVPEDVVVDASNDAGAPGAARPLELAGVEAPF